MQLRHDSFLEGIYGHAAEASAEPLEPLLSEILTPLLAPGDACWQSVEELPDLPARVAATRPHGTAPGWLWPRIREDGRRSRGRRARPVLRLVAAAGLFVAGLVGIRAYFPETGTSDPSRTVFEEISDREFDAFDRIVGG